MLASESWVTKPIALLRRWTVRLALIAIVALLAFGVLINHQASWLLGNPPANNIDEPDTTFDPEAAALFEAPTIAIDKQGDLNKGFSMPARTIAITFDDGPHPVWTPAILDELDRLDVKATFFVVGDLVQEYPGLVNDIVDRGHEIGNHTHFHYRMGDLDGAQVARQLDLARLAIIDATGVGSRLYRPPYSGAIRNLDPMERVGAKRALERGYVLVATDLAPPDYNPDVSVESLLADAIPPVGAGAVLTLHDGGGADRSRTLELLEPLVTSLRDRGYEISLVGEEVARVTGVDPITPAGDWEGFKATALAWVLRGAGIVESIAIAGSIVFVFLFVARFSLLLVMGIRQRIRLSAHREDLRKRLLEAKATGTDKPPVTVIVPAYNEAVGIEASIRSIDATDWPELEILVVDDGSTDDTANIAESLGIERVRVLRKPNGGKASALNLGIAKARHDILVMIDGDTILEPDTVPELMEAFIDPSVGAVAGNPKIGNTSKPVARLQATEYLLSSSLERRILAPAQMITTIPGAVGAWRRSAVQEVGGVSDATLAEDTDLTVAIARGGWRIAYAPHARAWTEAPSTVNSLYRQRVRWTYGTLQVIWKHRKSIRDRGAGSQLGRFALPYIFITGYVFAALAPIIDLVLLANVFLGEWELALASWSILAAVATGAALIAAELDDDWEILVLFVPLQQLVFRPLLHLVALVSLRRAVLGERQLWGAQQRVGGLVIGGGAKA